MHGGVFIIIMAVENMTDFRKSAKFGRNFYGYFSFLKILLTLFFTS